MKNPLPHRPLVELRLPREVRAGDELQAEIRLKAKRPVRVASVFFTLRGQERSGPATYPFLRLQAELLTPEVLPSGETRLRCRATIPADAPPRYEGSPHYQVEYLADIHVDVPWWPDRRVSYVVPVRPRDEPLPDEEPYHFSTRPAGPLPGKMHLEGIVDRRVLLPGGTISGRVALSNIAAIRYRELTLDLIGEETMHGLRREGKRYSLRLPLPTADGDPIDFRMRVPDVAPTFQGHHGRLDWKLVLTAVGRGGEMRVPIPVRIAVPGENAEARQLATALPSIGNRRVAELWERIGAAERFRLEDDALVSEEGAVTMRLGRAHRGREGVFLEATLHYPSLGMGLDGGLRTGFQRVLALGEPGEGFFREHYVAGRDDDQAREFGDALFAAWAPPHRVDDLHDEALTLSRAGGTEDPPAITETLRLLRRLAARLEALRQDLPLPRAFADAGEAWEALAEELEGGALARGPMEIAGRLDGVPVALRTEWSDEGPTHRLEARPAHALEPTFVASRVAELDAGDTKLSAEARTLARALLERTAEEGEVRTLEVEAERLQLPLAQGVALQDPRPHLADLRRLLRLGAALRAGAGPYR